MLSHEAHRTPGDGDARGPFFSSSLTSRFSSNDVSDTRVLPSLAGPNSDQ